MNNTNLELREPATTPDPFNSAPAEGDFFVLTPPLQHCANTLINIAKSGTSIGLVKGDPGAGKSSLVTFLCECLRKEPNIRLLRFNARQDVDLIPVLAKAIGMDDDMLGSEPRKRFIEQLTQLRGNGTKVVLMIDDAHLLTPQSLHLVIRLGLSPVSGQSGLIHTLMFAESDIEGRLWLSAITDPLPLDRLYTLVLPALNAEQTLFYLNHRLQAAGMQDSASFSQADAGSIQRKTGGLPQQINELARRQLGRHGSAHKISLLPLFSSASRRPAVALLSVSLVVILSALWWWNAANSPDTGSSATKLAGIELPSIEQSLLTANNQPPPAAGSRTDADSQAGTDTAAGQPVAPDLRQQNYHQSVDANNYTVQKTAQTLATPLTPDNPPVPRESFPDPQASPPFETTPAVSESPGIPHQAQTFIEEPALTATAEAAPGTTPSAPLSPQRIESQRLRANSILVQAPDTISTDLPPIEMPKDRMLDQPLRIRTADTTPTMPALTEPDSNAALLQASLPPSQPVAIAKPLAGTTRSALVKTNIDRSMNDRAQEPVPAKPDATSELSEEQAGQPISLSSVRRETWLKQRQPNEYAIQILAGPNEVGLRQFIAQNRFPTTPGYYHARNGQYKLVLPYANERQARQALTTLPKTLQRYGQPWIRSMADVQKDML